MGYVELHAHSTYSLLDGASSPEELVARAAELGMEALALTDHNGLYGAVRFAKAAKQYGVRPIFGAELTLTGGHHLTLLVRDETGWGNLCRLISLAQQNAPKGEAALPSKDLVGRTLGLIALTGCRRGPVAAALIRGERERAVAAASGLRQQFGVGNTWIELQHHLRPDDSTLVADLMEVARETHLDYVATGNVHYADRRGHRLQDVLVAVRHTTTLDASSHLRRPNAEYYLKSSAEMQRRFADYPDAVRNTRRLASECRFELAFGVQELPQFPTPPGVPAWAYLTYLCRTAMRIRYPDAGERVWGQLERELEFITASGLANYFLVVWDIVHFAHTRGIRCHNAVQRLAAGARLGRRLAGGLPAGNQSHRPLEARSGL